MSQRARLVVVLGALAGLSGCGTEEGTSPVRGPLRGELSVDIRERASVTIDEGDGGALKASITLTKGYGVAPASVLLSGAGRAEPLPEANVTLYTARVEAPADPSGPCGEAPVSLALSLHTRGGAPRVSGSLAAYCGKGVWSGNPVKLLRLAGELKR